MKQTDITVVILEPSEGYVLTNQDETVFSSKLYLGASDSPYNYHEVTQEYAEEKQKEMEEQQQKELETAEAIRSLQEDN